jgi:hypothetical protein
VSDESGPPARGDRPEDQAAELEAEIEQLEERVEVTVGGDSARRVRHLRKQVREASPDALFSAEGGMSVRGIARRTDSYGFVLVLLAVLIWVFVPFASNERWATIPTLLVFFLTVLISMHTSFVREKWLVVVLVADSGLLLLGVIGVLSENESVRSVSNFGYGALLFATALVVLRRVLSHQTVNSRTLSGAVAAFLFVGLAFACMAEATVLRDPNAYNAAGGNTNFASMLYFSFVTIATLGYGDIVPVSSTARSFATMEAVMGQIYLVTIVARLVSLLGVRRFTTVPDPSTTTPPDPDPQSQ